MKFAPHIGLSSPEDVMFPHYAGSDPIDQGYFILSSQRINSLSQYWKSV